MKIIIIGAGEVGFHIASRLSLENKDVVLIDKNQAAVQRVSESIDVQVIVGSGSSPVVLEGAGIKEAEILLAVTDSDETNLVACLTASLISPSTRKLARIRNADFDKYHDIFRDQPPYINTVINPEIEVVKTIDQLLSVPGASDVGAFADGRLKLIGIRLKEPAAFAGKTLAQLPDIMGDYRLLITAIIRNEVLTIPRGNDRLEAGDLVYFICEADKLSETLGLFNEQAGQIKRVIIVGGGRIGYRLAALLEEKSVFTKIIEKSPIRCAELAEKLNRTVVLQGDGSDHGLLLEENISEMDAMVTLTGEEETNILAALLARKMGVSKTIVKINKFSYLSLMPTIGLDQVVSPRLSAINTILQHIRRGKVLSAISIMGEQAEVLEAVAMETSDIVGKPLRNSHMPKGSLVVSIMRGDKVIIPSGESVIEPDDRIIVFARRDAIPKIEKILSVKLEYF
ncbi:MAG: Trk system potassium transporter TrkA [Desulfobacterales bacterium]|nr:Trk system potassium transporter TrkA [Desulfobacterales bacterium]